MNKTKIEWVKNPDGTQGYTWNPITGCLGGCEYCYARKLANGRLRGRYLANSCLPTHDEPDHQAHHDDPFYPRFWDSVLWHLLPRIAGSKHYKQKGIFACDMSDLFGIGIPEVWTHKILQACEVWGNYRFYLLTKQPQNLIKFNPFPDNCWVGVSVTNAVQFMEAVRFLWRIKAKVKYISFEPLLEQICPSDLHDHLRVVHWVIIGSQTKPYNPPKTEWVDEIVEAADKSRIPVFLKNNLDPLIGQNSRYKLWKGDGLYGLRQDMPK